MYLPKIKLLLPESIPEAARLLLEHGPASRLVAGGTDLFPLMKYGVTRAETLISLHRRVPEKPAVDENGSLHLDTFMTLADLVRSPEIKARALSLTEAAHSVASNQIRNMATLGGNICQDSRCLYYNQSHTYQFMDPCFKRGGDQCYFLAKGTRCWAVLMSDAATALVSLAAQVIVTGAAGNRTVPIEQLFSGDPIAPLTREPDQIISGVVIPRISNDQGTAFRKFSLRGGLDYPVINVAVALSMANGSQTCSEARVVLGAVSAAPVRATKAEEALTGQRLSEELCRAAAGAAASEVSIFPRDGFSVPYLRKCVEVFTAEALATANQRASC